MCFCGTNSFISAAPTASSRICIFVDYEFDLEPQERDRLVVAAAIIVSIILWRLATGDWDVAVAFGNLIVALITLVVTRSQSHNKADDGKRKTK